MRNSPGSKNLLKSEQANASSPWRRRVAISPLPISFGHCFLLGYLVRGYVDPDRLRQALEAVVMRWPLLGGRIRVDKDSPSGYVLAIPRTFDEHCRPFYFTSAKLAYPLRDVFPDLGRVSEPTLRDRPSFETRAKVFSPLPDAPVHFKDYLDLPPSFLARIFGSTRPERSTPILYLHVGHYSDGSSTICLRMAHAAFDGGGTAMVVRELEHAVRDPEGYASLPPIEAGLGPTEGPIFDPLAALRAPGPSNAPRSSGYVQVNIRWALWFICTILWRRLSRRYQAKVLLVPQEYVQKLVQGVNVEVKAKHGANIYVSTGDVFAALLWKATLKPSRDTSNPTTFMQAVDLRSFLPSLPSPWIGSIVAHYVTPSQPIPISSIQTLSLAETAMLVRTSIKENTRERWNNLVRWRLDNHTKKVLDAPMVAPHAHVVGLSNRLKTGIGSIGVTNITTGGDGKTLHSFCMTPPQFLQFDSYVIQDYDGVFCIEGRARQGTWAELLRVLQAYSWATSRLARL